MCLIAVQSSAIGVTLEGAMMIMKHQIRRNASPMMGGICCVGLYGYK